MSWKELDGLVSDLSARLHRASEKDAQSVMGIAESKLEEIHRICVSQLLELKPQENISMYTEESIESSTEAEIKFSVCGCRLSHPLQDKEGTVIIPIGFLKSSNEDDDFRTEEPMDITEKYAGRKRKNTVALPSAAPTKPIFNITSLSQINPLVPLKGDVNDMLIGNLRDFWSWIEHQQYFSIPPTKEVDIESLQFLQPTRVDIDDRADFPCATVVETSDDSQLQSPLYQRLVACLVLDASSNSSGSLVSPYKTDQSVPSSATKKHRKGVRGTSKKSVDISAFTLEERTKMVLTVGGIFDQSILDSHEENSYYPNVEVDEDDFVDDISLQETLRSLSEVENTVNERLANLRTCMDDLLFKTETDLRKSREYEKLLFTRWQKYVRKNHQNLEEVHQ